jgi:mono/diheme cytochrome c family protein
MRSLVTLCGRNVGRVVLGLSAVWLVVAAVPAAAQTPTTADHPVTFTKDVAPILQEHCQQCHRPGTIAPMSLITYEQVRPYARAIKQRTQLAYVLGQRGAMPPWFIERNVGIQKFKDDVRLSDAQIATLAKWADTGAPLGNPADMPPPRVWADDTAWQLGQPDLIVTSPTVTVKATAPEWWGTLDNTPTELAEDRYALSIENKETSDLARGTAENKTGVGQGKLSNYVFHHNFLSVQRPNGEDRYQLGITSGNRSALVFQNDAAKLIPAKAVFGWDVHIHAPGVEGAPDRHSSLSAGFKFQPRGYKPKYRELRVGSGTNDIQVRPDSDTNRYDLYFIAPEHMKLVNYTPHMHAAGIRMCMEAIYQNYSETLACAGVDHNWMRNYQYDDDSAPLIPKGAILHTIAWLDGTAKNANLADPRNMTLYGRRSVSNMLSTVDRALALSEEQYQQEIAKRKQYLDRTDGWNQVIGCPGCFGSQEAAAPIAVD